MTAEFIKMIPELHNQRYLMQIQNLIRNKIPCAFFCGFDVPNNLEATINNLKSIGINLTCVIVVDDSQKMGGGGTTPFVTLEELPHFQLKPSQIFISAGGIFRDYFLRYGMNTLGFSNFNGAENLYSFYLNNLPNLYETYEMLSDEESKKVFTAYVKGRVTERVGDFRFAPEPQYFLEGFLPIKGDIAIDGGAYDGATSRDFTMQGAKVYAFEMDAANYKNCLPRAEQYNFTIENIGLSNQEGEEYYQASGVGSGKGRGNLVAHFIDLDTYVNKKNLPRVDYIKLDIEGAELDMLHGATKTISRWKPKMAISAYHKPEDLWTLANYIKSIRPDYEFKFRHYKIDGTNYVLTDVQKSILKHFRLNYFLPSVYEMVLYCR